MRTKYLKFSVWQVEDRREKVISKLGINYKNPECLFAFGIFHATIILDMDDQNLSNRLTIVGHVTPERLIHKYKDLD